jgi:glycosyltransferase involved in cell wall biosynthesis
VSASILKYLYKVLHAPTSVGGNPQGLSEGLNSNGIHSTTLSLRRNYFNYPSDFILWADSDGPLLREIKRICFLIKTLFTYKVIHYNFGATIASPTFYLKGNDGLLREIFRRAYYQYLNILQLFELRLFKIFGKVLFMTCQGDDARQGDFLKNNFDIHIGTQVDQNYYPEISDIWKRKSILRISRYCDKIYAVNPDLLNVLPSKTAFIGYTNIRLKDWPYIEPQLDKKIPLKIVHAPSHRDVKGTKHIESTVARLKDEGFQIDFILVEGLSNQDAREVYKACDIFIDQLFAGWYGGVAVEAMALGKPVLTYIRESDLRFIPKEMKDDLPVVSVTTTSLYFELRKIIELPRVELGNLSRRSRSYVEKWHNPKKIAKSIQADYESFLEKKGKS